MTRKSRRKLERAIEDLDTDAPRRRDKIVIRYTVVDGDSEVTDTFDRECEL